MAKPTPIEDRVRDARMDHGPHGDGGHRYSFTLWPMFRRPPKAAHELVKRLRGVVDAACSPEDAALLKEWCCKPVFYDPAYLPRRGPGSEEKETARKLCHKRALAAFGKPGRVLTDWTFGDGSHTGWSVVVIEDKEVKENG